jgi:hypothetical protein
MAEQRHTVSIEAIKDGLLGRLDDLIHRLAPPAPGSFTDHDGRFFTLNPGRADRSVGSFWIHTRGAMAGRWVDMATGGKGDAIDLFALSLNLGPADAIREARAFLGLETETPEMRRIREAAAVQARARRAAAEAEAKEKAKRRRRAAQGLWLSGQERIAGTPVEAYLTARGIDLGRLGRQPRSIRYHPECLYFHQAERFDPETGEVLCGPDGKPLLDSVRQKLPAMVTAIVDGKGNHVATHRTYLARGADGIWRKAAVDTSKKVLGDFRGGCVRLSSGIGPRGGKAARLNDCPPGTRVYIAEGIETALSALMLRPELRVLAAVSLSNMGAVELPANVAEVVLIADADEHPQARASLDAAVAAHVKAGRVVRIWRSDVPGADLNDALQRAMNDAKGAA